MKKRTILIIVATVVLAALIGATVANVVHAYSSCGCTPYRTGYGYYQMVCVYKYSATSQYWSVNQWRHRGSRWHRIGKYWIYPDNVTYGVGYGVTVRAWSQTSCPVVSTP